MFMETSKVRWAPAVTEKVEGRETSQSPDDVSETANCVDVHPLRDSSTGTLKVWEVPLKQSDGRSIA
jgi:hypothetical protein